ncbi:hypothetical protein PL10110_170114 [Planktothrix agardhii]|nr:hypothetical protein PL10110_170114 [Planktothrix agardhii]
MRHNQLSVISYQFFRDCRDIAVNQKIKIFFGKLCYISISFMPILLTLKPWQLLNLAFFFPFPS